MLADKPSITTESESMDRGVLDRLLLHTGTLSSIYHQAPETFIRGAKPKSLHSSPALDPQAKQSFLESLNLPKHIPPEHIITTGLTSAYDPEPPTLPPKPLSPLNGLSSSPEQGTRRSDSEERGDEDTYLEMATSTTDPYAGLSGFGGSLGRQFLADDEEEEGSRGILS